MPRSLPPLRESMADVSDRIAPHRVPSSASVDSGVFNNEASTSSSLVTRSVCVSADLHPKPHGASRAVRSHSCSQSVHAAVLVLRIVIVRVDARVRPLRIVTGTRVRDPLSLVSLTPVVHAHLTVISISIFLALLRLLSYLEIKLEHCVRG